MDHWSYLGDGSEPILYTIFGDEQPWITQRCRSPQRDAAQTRRPWLDMAQTYCMNHNGIDWYSNTSYVYDICITQSVSTSLVRKQFCPNYGSPPKSPFATSLGKCMVMFTPQVAQYLRFTIPFGDEDQWVGISGSCAGNSGRSSIRCPHSLLRKVGALTSKNEMVAMVRTFKHGPMRNLDIVWSLKQSWQGHKWGSCSLVQMFVRPKAQESNFWCSCWLYHTLSLSKPKTYIHIYILFQKLTMAIVCSHSASNLVGRCPICSSYQCLYSPHYLRVTISLLSIISLFELCTNLANINQL